MILTYNEAPNIARTLEALAWARRIVVVDSFSDDSTEEVARRFSNVAWFHRRFDTHAGQWNYAIGETGIESEWILALDADYVLTSAFIDELQHLHPAPDACGYANEFEYCILGKPLRGSVYPPVTTLFRRGLARYEQDGHTQRLKVDGRTEFLSARIQHDDRKTISRWLTAQSGYMKLEADKLSTTPWKDLPVQDRIRKAVILAPFLVFFYTLFVRGTILDGRAGIFYAFQRTAAEIILSMHLLDRRLRKAG